jgi:ABC-type multidrug transport system fused ATPase/permease subunit
MINQKKYNNLIRSIFDLYNSFRYRRKLQFVYLIFLNLISILCDVISIGAIVPFIAMLTAPDKLFNHQYLSDFNRIFNINTPNELIIPITFIFIVIVICSGFFRILVAWITTRLTSAVGSELSTEVFKRVLFRPYLFHIKQNSGELINTLTHKVDAVVFGVIMPTLLLISSMMLTISLFITMLIIQPIISLLAILIFGFSYFMVARFVRKKLLLNSNTVVTNQFKSIKILQESLGGIRDLILDGNQAVFIDYYRETDIPLRRSAAANNFVGQFPRYVMEIVAFIVMALLAFFLTNQSGSIQKTLPILGAIGLASQRILPAIQQMYNAWASVTATSSQLSNILDYLQYPIPTELKVPDLISFNNSIKLSKLSFRYSDNSPIVISDLNLIINKGDRVGIIGSTGSGKSTLIDIIMGLLNPTDGSLIIDGVKLDSDSLRYWQKQIAHVPQSIFLADASIAENIALGVPKSLIDYSSVTNAASVACVTEFMQSYPNGLETIVGERGINLSGGQRQRIGIARALYKNASVLVLDEATSALDNDTEKEVMHSISSLNRSLTILIIAHRLTTLYDCDYIIELKDGKLIKKATSQIIAH